MTLQGDDRALTPARAGVARAGATRFGHAPDDVQIDAGQALVAYRPAAEDDQNISTTWTEEDLTP